MTPPVLTELRIAPFHYPVATSYTQAYTPFPPIPLRLGDPFLLPAPPFGRFYTRRSSRAALAGNMYYRLRLLLCPRLCPPFCVFG